MSLIINEALLLATLEKHLQRHADAGGAWLIEALSHPGSGRHYMGNPNPSSTPDEMPAPQTRALIDSIDVRPAGRLASAIGSFADQDAEGYAHALDLESSPPDRGGRQFLERTLHDADFHRALLTGKGMP